MKNKILIQLLKDCESRDIDLAIEALNDLGYVIERFTVIRSEIDKDKIINEYRLLFYREELISVELSINDYNHILYYLFYLLMNFPDRSSKVAWCFGKCYDKSIQTGLCMAIEVFMNKNCDEVVVFLLKSITDINQFQDLEKETLELFHKIKESKLIYSSDFAQKQLDFYNKSY